MYFLKISVFIHKTDEMTPSEISDLGVVIATCVDWLPTNSRLAH